MDPYLSSAIRSTARAVLVLLAFSLIGCGAHHSLPANWDRDLPGIYDGTVSVFGSYELWPLPDGKNFSKISADVNFEFVPSRTEGRSL